MTENQKEFETLPATQSPAHVPIEMAQSLFFNAAKFELAQRVAKVFAASDMVPKQFQGNIGNCVIALNLAERMGTDPFMLMQNIYIVHGKPGIEAKLAIALVNATGKFTPLQYQYNDNRSACYAHAKLTTTGEECKGTTVSLKMAQDEGWMSKQGSKWKTMPELMLMYRAAMFFARAYCPEALLGMQTREELHDVGAVDMVPAGNGSYEPEESSEDLAAKILNGPGQDEPSLDQTKMEPSDKAEHDKEMSKPTIKPEKFLQVKWNPLDDVIQRRYSDAKRTIIMGELDERGIVYNPGWSGARLHRTLLDDVPVKDDPPDVPEPKPEPDTEPDHEPDHEPAAEDRTQRDLNERLHRDFPEVWDLIRARNNWGLLCNSEEQAEIWNRQISEELDKWNDKLSLKRKKP